MEVNVSVTIDQLMVGDLKRLDEIENSLIDTARETVDAVMIKLKARRWNRFIRYCHTGRFD